MKPRIPFASVGVCLAAFVAAVSVRCFDFRREEQEDARFTPSPHLATVPSVVLDSSLRSDVAVADLTLPDLSAAIADLRAVHASESTRHDLIYVLKRLDSARQGASGARNRLQAVFGSLDDPLQRALLLLAIGDDPDGAIDWIRAKADDREPLVACFAVLALLPRHEERPVQLGEGVALSWHAAALLVGFAQMLDMRAPGFARLCEGSCLADLLPCETPLHRSMGAPLVQALLLRRSFAVRIRPEEWSPVVQVIEEGHQPASRWFAVQMLDASGNGARYMSTFVRMLLSSDTDDRVLAARGIGSARSEEGALRLLELAGNRSDDSAVRLAALDNVDHSPYASVPGAAALLLGLLEDEDVDVACSAARLLGRLQDPTASCALIGTLLSASDEGLRISALNALTKWPGIEEPTVRQAFDEVIRQDPDSVVAQHARLAIGAPPPEAR